MPRDGEVIACLRGFDTAGTDRRSTLLLPCFPFSNSNTEKVWKPAIILVAFAYDPLKCTPIEGWWAVQDSNLRPPACKAGALTS